MFSKKLPGHALCASHNQTIRLLITRLKLEWRSTDSIPRPRATLPSNHGPDRTLISSGVIHPLPTQKVSSKPSVYFSHTKKNNNNCTTHDLAGCKLRISYTGRAKKSSFLKNFLFIFLTTMKSCPVKFRKVLCITCRSDKTTQLLVTANWRFDVRPLLTAKHRLGRSLFLLQNRFLALVLPNLNRSR